MSSDNFMRVRKGLNLTPGTLPTSGKIGDLTVDQSDNKIKTWNGSNWVQVGSNAGGELNFLALANVSWDAESGTIGFTTYKDAAQSRPVDGTGGSPSVTITTSNTNPLSGNNSLIITKPSGNLQGEGVSVNFSVDRASRAKVLKIEFDYLVNSGTFNAGTNTADSDLIVYIYDVDADQLIEPSSFKLYANATNIADKFSGYFQTSADSTNYRLIFHVATTNSSSWSLKVDNVVVSPSKYVYGTPITDWQSYTPTVNGLGTGSGTATGLYRRVGGNVEIKFRFVKDSSNGSGSSVVRFSLPAGIAVDTSRLTIASSNVNACGYANSNGIEGTPNNFVTSAVLHAGYAGFPNEFTISNPGAGGNAEYVGSDFRANSTLDGFATFPVQGWSSSVKMSDGYDGREIIFEGTNSSFSVGTNTTQDVTITTSIDTVKGQINNTTYRVQASGYYEIWAMVAGSLSGTNDLKVRILVNGSLAAESYENGSWVMTLNPRRLMFLNAGDEVKWQVQTYGLATTFNNFRGVIRRLASPQTIGMNEVVAARYKTASGQTITNNTGTIINFNTKEYDTHNAVTTGSNWKFTAPVAGIYSLSSFAWISAFNVTAPGSFSVYVQKNGTFYADFGRTIFGTESSNINIEVCGSIETYLNAGDTINVLIFNASGANRTLYNNEAYVWVTIHKIS